MCCYIRCTKGMCRRHHACLQRSRALHYVNECLIMNQTSYHMLLDNGYQHYGGLIRLHNVRCRARPNKYSYHGVICHVVMVHDAHHAQAHECSNSKCSRGTISKNSLLSSKLRDGAPQSNRGLEMWSMDDVVHPANWVTAFHELSETYKESEV